MKWTEEDYKNGKFDGDASDLKLLLRNENGRRDGLQTSFYEIDDKVVLAREEVKDDLSNYFQRVIDRFIFDKYRSIMGSLGMKNNVYIELHNPSGMGWIDLDDLIYNTNLGKDKDGCYDFQFLNGNDEDWRFDNMIDLEDMNKPFINLDEVSDKPILWVEFNRQKEFNILALEYDENNAVIHYVSLDEDYPSFQALIPKEYVNDLKGYEFVLSYNRRTKENEVSLYKFTNKEPVVSYRYLKHMMAGLLDSTEDVEFIDGNSLNFSKSNLRKVTNQEIKGHNRFITSSTITKKDDKLILDIGIDMDKLKKDKLSSKTFVSASNVWEGEGYALFIAGHFQYTLNIKTKSSNRWSSYDEGTEKIKEFGNNLLYEALENKKLVLS